MPQPDIRASIVAGPLQMVSVLYRNLSYIADRVFPIIDRVPPKAKIYRYLKGAWFRDEAGIRGPSSRANRGGFPTDYIDVSTREYAFAKEVTDEDRRNAGVSGAPPAQPETDAILFASDKIDLRKERLVRDLIATTLWSGIAAGGTDAAGAWAAGAGNTFLADIKAKKALVRRNTGITPNKLILDYGTYMSLTEEATILDKIKYTERGVLTKELLAAILELDEVLVGDAVYSSAAENKAGSDFTAVDIWTINATKGMGFLFYAPSTPGLKIPSAGYQAREALEGGLPRRVSTWREPAEHQDVYEIAESTHIVAVSADLGYLWKDTLLT
jgi:hypothetical protein